MSRGRSVVVVAATTPVSVTCSVTGVSTGAPTVVGFGPGNLPPPSRPSTVDVSTRPDPVKEESQNQGMGFLPDKVPFQHSYPSYFVS